MIDMNEVNDATETLARAFEEYKSVNSEVLPVQKLLNISENMRMSAEDEVKELQAHNAALREALEFTAAALPCVAESENLGHNIEHLSTRLESALSLTAPESYAKAKDGWQPIETAPKGVKGYVWMMLSWGGHGDETTGVGMRVGDTFFAPAIFYCPNLEKKYEFREIQILPTHWMPLPEPPIKAAHEDGIEV